MFIYIYRQVVFFLCFLFCVRLGLRASYQIIDRRYVITESQSDIVIYLRGLAVYNKIFKSIFQIFAEDIGKTVQESN